MHIYKKYCTNIFRLYLNEKWEDGFSFLGIIWKFFNVISMLADGPDHHLVQTSHGEQAG